MLVFVVVGRVFGGRGLGMGGEYGSVESTSSDDLMHVWRGNEAGIDERIRTFDYELGAAETEEIGSPG
jgi:hypothetical protein